MTIALPSSAQPDFLVIGTGRSGTTSLHRYLSQHHQLFLQPKILVISMPMTSLEVHWLIKRP